MVEITAGDFLAGGGGVTEAMSQVPDMKVKWVLNHDKIAIRTNMFNHKGVKHYWSDIYKQDEHEMESVDFVWASIECTQHSQANGGREKKIGSYMLGWELVRYVRHLYPLVVGIENVPEFKKWAPLNSEGQPDKTKQGEEFENWKNTICAIGYEYHEKILNAADFGVPTRRIRYFAFFTRIELGMQINWPKPSHNRTGSNGLNKWIACKNYIDLKNEGESIFGREFNPNIRNGQRKKLSENTLKRIAGGIKKFAPELSFIMQYYGNGLNAQTYDTPLNTIPTKDRHALVTVEKQHFVQDHCHTDNYNLIEDPMNPILTRQQKQLITLEKKQFIADYYGRNNTAHDLNGPANTITCENLKHIITTQFISKQYNSNGDPKANNHSIDEPLGTLTTKEKNQFISAYFNSNGNPDTQNQSIDYPLGSILTGSNKKALVTPIEKGEFDFDIKMRFLDPEELSQISTFPKGYFTHPLLKLTKKEQTKLIGNAVPPEWAKQIIAPVVEELKNILLTNKVAI